MPYGAVPYPGGGPWGAWPPPIENFARRERKREKREEEKEKRNKEKNGKYIIFYISFGLYIW